MDFLILMIVLWLLAVGCGKVFLLLFRPDVYMQEKQHQHERQMENRRMAGGLFGLIARFFR